MRTGRAGRHDGVVRALDPQRDRELAARGVHEDVWEEVRRDAVGPAFAADILLLEDPADAADGRPENDADARRVEAVQPGVANRLSRGTEREEHIALELPDFLGRGDLTGVEILHLCGDADGQFARVEGANPVDSALARDRGTPGRLHVVAQRRDRAQSRDGDPSHHVSLDLRCPGEVTNA